MSGIRFDSHGLPKHIVESLVMITKESVKEGKEKGAFLYKVNDEMKLSPTKTGDEHAIRLPKDELQRYENHISTFHTHPEQISTSIFPSAGDVSLSVAKGEEYFIIGSYKGVFIYIIKRKPTGEEYWDSEELFVDYRDTYDDKKLRELDDIVKRWCLTIKIADI